MKPNSHIETNRSYLHNKNVYGSFSIFQRRMFSWSFEKIQVKVVHCFLICLFGITLATESSACNIDFNIELQTFGENVNVELRSGSPGHSRRISSQTSHGGRVSFNNLCPGSYFLAIGNDDYVNVTPVRQFQSDYTYSSRLTIKRGSGNVSKQSRKSL